MNTDQINIDFATSLNDQYNTMRQFNNQLRAQTSLIINSADMFAEFVYLCLIPQLENVQIWIMAQISNKIQRWVAELSIESTSVSSYPDRCNITTCVPCRNLKTRKLGLICLGSASGFLSSADASASGGDLEAAFPKHFGNLWWHHCIGVRRWSKFG
jgi:hypothetical protein